ncbi:MAG: glycosyltransferase [Desulfobacterales bacterium]
MRFSISVIEPAGYKYSHFLYDLCKYLCFSIESSGYDCCILRNKLAGDRTNILVGAHIQSDPSLLNQVKQNGAYIVLNTEIITGDSINNWSVQKTFSDVYLPLMRQASAVWTGVQKNIEALKKLNIEADQILWGYHPLMEEIHDKKNKDIDFLFCGSITPHRKKLLDQLTDRGCKVVTMFDDAAMYRNDLIARSRVNLAPNQGPGMNHLGGGRVLYLINNHAIVVVERCIDQCRYEHCFLSADTEQWVDLCMETLHRPDLAQVTEEYYERFKKIPMADLIAPLLENVIRKIESSRLHAPATTVTPQTTTATSNEVSRPLLHTGHANAVAGLTSIIILTHNRLDQTKKCVKSIHRHTPEPHEIFFVDNGSTDGTVKWLQRQITQNRNCHLIENNENAGTAKGRNQGMEACRGEFIALLNNDVAVAEGWLSAMLDCLNRGRDAGIVGPMTNKSSGIQKVTDESYRSVDYLDQYAAKFKKRYRYRQIPCRNLARFCMLFKRTLMEKIGLLDECFGTGHFEDEDLCLKAALYDYRNYVAGDVFVHRLTGKESRGDEKIIKKKWALSCQSETSKKLAILKATELAYDLYSKGKLDQAIEALVDCIKITPDAKQIYYELARFFIESKKFSEAWEVVGTMPEEAKNALKGLEYSGYAKEGVGRDDEAAGYAERMLAMNETYAPALNLRGVLAYKQNDPKMAESWFRKAIEVEPGYGEVYTNLGVLNWSMDQKEVALTHLRKGFSLSPTIPDVSSLYFSVVSSLGIYGDAEVDFREASKLYPNNKNIAILYIETLIQQEKFSSAMIEIENALASFGLDEGSLKTALAVRDKIGLLSIKEGTKQNTLSLCMIVKNEEKHLPRCLKSVRNVVDEMIIVDTGSTDKTIDIARIFGAKVFEFPWTGDFSAARNHSLDQATGDWILILDADEVVSALDFSELQSLLRKKSVTPAAYSIVTRNYVTNVSFMGWTPNNGQYPEEAGAGWVASTKVRLFPRRKDVFFSNPVHEILEDSLKNIKLPIFPCNIVVHHYGKLDVDRNTQKGENYYLLGKMKYESDPTNVQFINELAKQAQVLDKYEEAVELWLKLLSLIEDDHQSPGYKEIAKVSYGGDPLSEIYSQLALAYLTLDRFEEALKTARKTIESRVRLKESVHIYANCEIIAGSLDNAFFALDELLNTTPDYPPALFLMETIFYLKGEKEKAQEILQTLLHSGVQMTPSLNKIARQLHANGKKDEALLILNAAIENNISNETTKNMLVAFQ